MVGYVIYSSPDSSMSAGARGGAARKGGGVGTRMVGKQKNTMMVSVSKSLTNGI